MSIRNISTNKKVAIKKNLGAKKLSFKGKNYEGLNEVSKKLTISGISAKIH